MIRASGFRGFAAAALPGGRRLFPRPVKGRDNRHALRGLSVRSGKAAQWLDGRARRSLLPCGSGRPVQRGRGGGATEGELAPKGGNVPEPILTPLAKEKNLR